MNDDLSILTDASNPSTTKFSRVGLLLVFLYLIPCVIALLSDSDHRGYYWIGNVHLLNLTFPWSFFLGSLLDAARFTIEPEPSGIFFSGDGIPTWRTVVIFYAMILIGIFLNSFFLFLIGEKLERFFKKLK